MLAMLSAILVAVRILRVCYELSALWLHQHQHHALSLFPLSAPCINLLTELNLNLVISSNQMQRKQLTIPFFI